MTYSAPSPAQLKLSIQTTSSYNGTHKNLLKIAQSFFEIDDEYATEILFGACVYGLEKIAASYYVLPPDGSRLFNSGSTVYKTLQAGLDITAENPLDDQQRLIYLTHFYRYVKNHPKYLEDNLQLTDIEYQLKSVLSRLSLDITLLLKRPPTLNTLSSEIKTIPQEYKPASGSLLSYVGLSSTNPERDNHINLIKLIDQQILADEKSDDEYEVRYGLLLYIMKQIENEYIARSPANSELYKMIQRALNIYHSSDLIFETQRRYLQHLASSILKIKDTLLEKTHFIHAIDVYLADHIAALSHPEKNLSFFSPQKIVNLCAKFGVQIYVGEAILSLAETHGLFDGVIAIFGKAVVPHVILAAIVANFIKNQLKSNLISTVTAQANHIVIYTAQQTIKISANSLEFLGELVSNLITSKNVHQVAPSDEWVLALLELPDSLFDHGKKELVHRIADVPSKLIIESPRNRFAI